MSPKKYEISSLARTGWSLLPVDVRNAVRPWIHRRRGPKNQALSTKPVKRSEPLLSVVVPVYNVENYVSECLDSVLNQDYRNLEIIVVDDGSTDQSPNIIASYAKMDSRIRVITLPQSGNGIARNRGIRTARGEYLTFADSDDIVEPGAYRRMVRQLESSGSDFVVGAFKRRKGTKTWLPQMMTEIHDVDRLQISVGAFPEIIRDIFLWNKVFRKDFWDTHIVSIPEGVLYEDQETLVRAYLRARSFDILRAPVYIWRIREDNTSITQQKGDLKDAVDRMNAAVAVTKLVESEADNVTKEAWFIKSLGEDLRLYIERVPNAGADYWGVLQTAVGILLDMAGLETLERLTLIDRVLVFLIAADSRDDVVATLISLRDNGRTYAVNEQDGRKIAELPFVTELVTSVPSHLLEMKSADVKMSTRLLGMWWDNPVTLRIRGAAYIHALDASKFPYNVDIALVNNENRSCLHVDSALISDGRVDQVSGDRWNSYSHAAFEAIVRTDELLKEMQAPKDGWSFQVTVSAGGYVLKDVVRIRDGELLPFQLPMGMSVGPQRVVAQIDRNKGLRLCPVNYVHLAKEVRVEGASLVVEFEGEDSAMPHEIALSSKDARITASRTTDSTGVSFRLPVPAPSRGGEDVWELLASHIEGQFHPVGWRGGTGADDSLPPADGVVRMQITGYGYLRVASCEWRVTVSGCTVDMDGKTLKLSGRSVHRQPGGEQIIDLVLATDRNVIRPLSISEVPGTDKFVAYFPLVTDKWGYGHSVPDAGHYRLTLRTIGLDGKVHRQRVKAVGSLLGSVPEEHMSDQTRLVLTAEDLHRNFVVKILPPFTEEERGARAQQLLRDRYLIDDCPVEPNSVLFESFSGKSTSDSGRSISKDLGTRLPSLKRYWTVSDFSVPVPEGCVGVLRYSGEWYRLLNNAGYLVNNNNFPPYFRKREKQVYLQTWHGTPLKKIGNHTPIKNLTASYRRLMEKEARSWDVLLAQNAFASEVLPEAFNFPGKVLTVGYPRNDALYADDAELVRNNMRRRFAISSETLVVLYMPTWRDNVRNAQNRFDSVNYLEFEKFVGAFEFPVVVLFRGHHNVAGQRNTSGGSTFIDVTAFPEIADLYLACDVMVTDYSSSMFDFCGTRKPIIFLAPDIDEYRDETRGFYFDFENDAPGPIVNSTDGVVSALRSLPALTEEYKDKYAAFVDKYAVLDDGNAAQRVVDAVFGWHD